MFDTQVKRNDMGAGFTESVWNMGSGDPCAGPPLSREELKSLGAFWLDDQPTSPGFRPGPMMMPYRQPFEAVPVTLTRLHVRYSADTFPEDLVFQETEDKENFQASYVLQHAWNGSRHASPAGKDCLENLEQPRPHEQEKPATPDGWERAD